MNDMTEKTDSRNSVRSGSKSASYIKNGRNTRIFKYWQEVVVTWLLISIGIGTIFYLFKILGLNGLSNASDKTLVSFLGIFYPWFIYIAGVILIFSCGIGLFKVYLPVMLSMNVTRKNAVIQIAVMLAELSAVICLVIGIVWKIEEAVMGEQIEMLFRYMGDVQYSSYRMCSYNGGRCNCCKMGRKSIGSDFAYYWRFSGRHRRSVDCNKL